MQRQKRQQFPKSQTLANRSCNRNAVCVEGFSGAHKKELLEELKKKYIRVYLTRLSREDYIVYEDDTRDLRSTYFSPVNLASKTKENKQPLLLEKKSQSSGENMVEKASITFDVRGSARTLHFSPLSRINKSNSNSNTEKPDASQITNPEKLSFDDVVNESQLAKDSTLKTTRTKLKLSEVSEQKQSNEEEKKLNEEEEKLKVEKELNRFIDNLLSASYDNFDKIFEDEIATLNQERIATLMIERFKRRKQELDEIVNSNQLRERELDEIAESNQLSMDKFLEKYLYSDPNPQTPQPQAQAAQAQTAQAPQPKIKNSKDEFQRDAGKIARQIFFKDRLSESLFQEYRKSQISLSVSQDISQKSATSPLNIYRISRNIYSNIYSNIPRDYVRSSPQNILIPNYVRSSHQNRLTSTSLDKSKERFTESFQRIYNQSISQSSSQLLPGQEASSGANSSIAINAGAGSSSQLLPGQASSDEISSDANSSDAINAGDGFTVENLDGPKRRSGSSRASTAVIHPFASGAGVSSTTIRPLGIKGLDLEVIGMNLSIVPAEAGIGNGSGRGGYVHTPRNTNSAPPTARGPGLHPPAISTNRSAPGQLENLETNESPRQFQDADEDPDDQNLTNFIQNFILETSFQNGVEESLDQSQANSLDQSLFELLDQSQANSPKNSISRELEKITQAKIVGLMKQKFSKFKVKFQRSNPPNSPQRINPELYRKFLFETDENGNTPQAPRPARSNSKMTVLEICKALAICLVEAENNPNEIAKSPQSTESSPQSAKSNDDSSRISSRSDYGGNAMTEILKILNDQKQSNLGSESFEQQPDPDQLTSDQQKSFNQDQEGEIINRENFTELLQRLDQIVSPEDEREEAGQSVLIEGAKVTAELERIQHSRPESLISLLPLKQEPDATLCPPSTQTTTSLPLSPKIAPHDSCGLDRITPPSSPAHPQDSPGAQAARNAALVSNAINNGSFQRSDDSEVNKEFSEVGRLSKNDPRLALFENGGSQNSLLDNNAVRPLAKRINMNVRSENSRLPSSPASEGEGQGPMASPAFTASTLFAGGSPATSGHSPTASLQTASPQELSPVATLNSLTSSPVSGSLGGPASDSETASHPNSPASAGASAGGSGSDSKIVSRSSSPDSDASAVGSAVESVDWAIEEVKADQLPFKYSIIPQDHQDQVNDQPNPKKDYDFFIQQSQNHEGEITNNEKTKIAIKFKKSEDNDLPMTDTIKENQAKELVKNAINRAIEETKKSYLTHSQNSSSPEDQIYYDYLEIAIDVGGVKNKADEFKNELKRKFKQENTELQIEESKIEDHFNKAQLLSENFQKIAKDKFGIFTGRIGEARSRVVGMRTKRIPLDLLNEVKREKLPPSTSPRDPDSPLASHRSMSPH